MKKRDVDLFITPAEVASLLGLTVQGLHKQLKEKNINTKDTSDRFHKIYPSEMRKFLDLKKLPIPNEIDVIHLVKGGVGKTTLVHGLAARASVFGFRTLMIDLDQQSNLTTGFGVFSTPKEDPTLIDAVLKTFKGKSINIKDVVVPITEFLHIIPANLTIANLELLLITRNSNIGNFLEKLLEPIRDDYDLIFIDCPPVIARVSSIAHCYADRILLPVNTDQYSIDGLELTLDHLTNLRESFEVNPQLSIVINKFDARQKILGNVVIDALTSRYKQHLMQNHISISKQLDNMVALNKCIWSMKTAKNPALSNLNDLLIEMFDLKNQWGSRKNQELKPQLAGELSNA